MALISLWNIDSFAKIAALYDKTKPLVSKCHTREQDIRPIGDRARKHERIKKINDKCYVLMDGYNTGDDVFKEWAFGKTGEPTEAEIIKLAPVVWRRHQGRLGKYAPYETITVRNGTGRGAHMARYQFLHRVLPRGLNFLIRNGKQFVRNSGVEYYLAKSNTVAAFAVPTERQRMQSGWAKHYTSRNDGVALTFRIEGGDIRFDAGGKAVRVPPTQRIDKRSKAKMKPHLDKFKQWAFTMAPMWDYYSTKQQQRVRDEVKKYTGTHWYSVLSGFRENTSLTREVIKDEQHPLRVALAYAILRDTHYAALMSGVIGIKTGEKAYRVTESSVKAQYNAKINQVCGFIKVMKGKR